MDPERPDPATAVARWTERATTVTVAGEAVAVVDLAPAGNGATAGNAPPLLVVHGFPTSSIDFAPLTQRLTALLPGRRIVLLDLPGYGLSDKPDRAYSLFAQADAVEAVAIALGLDRVDLLTHDMGDSVGGELLARSLDGASPIEFRRRVLTNGSIYLDLAHLTDGQKFLRALPDEALPAGPDTDMLTATLAELCGPDPHPDARDHLRSGAALAVRADGTRLLPRLIRYLDERAQHEARWTGAIERHPSPLLVLWGRHDPIAVPAMVDRLVERRAGLAPHWLDAGHWPMLERPDGFAAAVADFV